MEWIHSFSKAAMGFKRAFDFTPQELEVIQTAFDFKKEAGWRGDIIAILPDRGATKIC